MVRTVANLMTTNPVTISPTAPLVEALRLMRRYEIRHLPVCLGPELVGIVTDRDIQRHMSDTMGTVLESPVDAEHLERTLVEEAMTRSPIVVTPDTSLAEATDLMVENKVGALPVVERTDVPRLVGILSYIDLLAYLRELLEVEA